MHVSAWNGCCVMSCGGRTGAACLREQGRGRCQQDSARPPGIGLQFCVTPLRAEPCGKQHRGAPSVGWCLGQLRRGLQSWSHQSSRQGVHSSLCPSFFHFLQTPRPKCMSLLCSPSQLSLLSATVPECRCNGRTVCDGSQGHARARAGGSGNPSGEGARGHHGSLKGARQNLTVLSGPELSLGQLLLGSLSFSTGSPSGIIDDSRLNYA